MTERRPVLSLSAGPVAALVLVVLAAAYGIVLRLWLLSHTPINSDWAVVGLMGKGILAGHQATFYWGQQYGGAEPYVVAPVIWLTHGSPWAMGVTAAGLSAVAAVLVGLVVVVAGGRLWLALVAGAAVWVWPYAVVWNSIREYGFRGVTMVCGLVVLLFALRIHRGRANLVDFAVLGLAAGVGWWSSPEILYFVVPVAVVLLASWSRPFDRDRWLVGPWRPVPVLVTAGGAVVGALPWLYTNLGSGFASLQAGSLPSYGGLGYGGRLSVFFRDMLPVQLGVRTVPGGAWVGGNAVGPVLYGLAGTLLVAALAAALFEARRGRAAAPALGAAAGVLAFPFLYALIPSTGYWVDGRYGVYLPTLIVAVAALSLAGRQQRSAERGLPIDGRRGRHRRHRRATTGGLTLAVACAGLVGGGVLTVFGARAGGVPANPRTFFSGWGDPEAPARQVVSAMERHGIRYAYGDYWTSYVLDYLAPGRIVVSPSPLDVVRWSAAADALATAAHPAWLFYAPGRSSAAAQAFANPETGPGNYTEAQFTSLLNSEHLGFRVVHLGVLDAVVPDRRVTLPG